jgi:SAM-dependent methyltransferase
MLTPPQTRGRLGDTPARDYALKLQLFNAMAELELRGAIASLRLEPGMCVLDAGCGTGEVLGWLAKTVYPGGLAVGIDLSTAHLGAARARLQAGTPLLQADLLQPPLARGSFDLVWSANAVHHLPDPAVGARALADLLRSGGRLVLGQSALLPDMYFAWDARLERVTNEAVRAYYRDRYHISEHELTALRNLAGILRQAGLTNISARTLVIERIAPLDPNTHAYLLDGIFRGTWGERLRPYLAAADFEQLTHLCDPGHPDFALRRPDFHFLQTFTLAVGESVPPRPSPPRPL